MNLNHPIAVATLVLVILALIERVFHYRAQSKRIRRESSRSREKLLLKVEDLSIENRTVRKQYEAMLRQEERPVYDLVDSTGVVRKGLSLAQISRPCYIQMDDSSSQPVQAKRCMSCGEWRSDFCKPGGVVHQQVVQRQSSEGDHSTRVHASSPVQDGDMVYVDVRRDPFDRSHVVGQYQTDPIGNNVHDFKPAQTYCIGRDGEPDTYIDTSVSSDGGGGCD